MNDDEAFSESRITTSSTSSRIESDAKTPFATGRGATSRQKSYNWCVLLVIWFITSTVYLLSNSTPTIARMAAPARHALGVSRYIQPWRIVTPPIMPSVDEARGRVIYSAVKAVASEGLGHAMATINADLSAALRLNIAYTHRIGQHGSLTAFDERAVEIFFGWGDGNPTRDALSNACENTVAERAPVECVPCNLNNASDGGTWSGGIIKNVVDLPINLTYAYYTLMPLERQSLLEKFLRENNERDTLFQMPPELCAKSPAQSYFSNEARAYFYSRYWKRRSSLPANPRLDDAELTIAVHARRGDFFIARRPMTTISAFGRAIRHIMRAVQSRGGPFSRMRVAVIVYSEGVPGGDGRWRDHDVSRMQRAFLDTAGTPRDVHWVRELVVGGQPEFFPAGLRVEMRIATDTLQAAHEMIAADVFLGSLSGLSMHVVGSLSRAGIVGLPSQTRERWPGHSTYWPPTGDFHNLTALRNDWNDYADVHHVAAARALMMGRFMVPGEL